jgi:ribosomal protein S11
MKIRRKQQLKSSLRKEQLKPFHSTWIPRSRKYSKYPYLLTISFFRSNVFLTASDFQGRIKVWTNAGRSGFKGRVKTDYMALITVTEHFLKRLYKFGIRYVFFKFKNFRRGRFAIRKAFRRNKRKYRFRFLGVWTELHISFNGCRNKKCRRKRKRRFARRRWFRKNFRKSKDKSMRNLVKSFSFPLVKGIKEKNIIDKNIKYQNIKNKNFQNIGLKNNKDKNIKA